MKRSHFTKDSNARFFLAPLELKFAAGDGAISGHASIFGNTDRHGDVVHPGAFAKSLAEGPPPVMLWNHDPNRPVGVWTEIAEDEMGLKVTGELNLETQAGAETRALLKQRAVSGLSIGYRVPPGGADIDRKTGIRHLRTIELWEVSIVALPSNTLARITGVKGVDSIRAYESFLQESGFPRNAAMRLAGGGWPALARKDHSAAAELTATVKNAIIELRKVTR